MKPTSRTETLTAAALVTALAACAPPITGDSSDSDDTTPEPTAGAESPIDAPPVLDGPCLLGAPAPRRLVVTTTDFATGAVSVVDGLTGAVSQDVALGSVDALPFYHAGLVYLLHRYQLDALDVIDPDDGWATVSQQAIAGDAPSTNPHAIAFADDGLAYVPLFGVPEVRVFDLADPRAPEHVATLDLSPIADVDGNPEASLAVACGGAVFVTVERLDATAQFAPTAATDLIVAFDRESGRIHDYDPDAPGIQGLETLGRWARQWRLDPKDSSGQTLLALTTGLERINLAEGTVAWAVPQSALEAVGIDHYMLPQAFALDAAGELAYLASYRPDFSAVTLYRVGLDGRAPAVPEPIDEGLLTVERAIERIDDTLWYADTTLGDAGLRALDLTVDPPTPAFDGAISVGLAPYAMIAVP
ncbi:MAG: hypothetical protein R3A51_05030 [Nannocystaceae bacterium]